MKNYEIGDIIDSGGMGVVYKGRHVGLERDVAIKFILPHVASDEQSVERFLREARLAARINHPNVAHVYDTGVDDQGRPYIVMELLNGEPLKQRLSRGPMTEADAVEIAKQVLMALEKAHSMGVIHRDIKPGNIFLTVDRMAKILDFGVAKGLDSGSGNVTLAGKTVGSPAYMSPEQAEGETVDARTDLYSVGVVLYEMLTGSVPFKGENSLAIMQKHLSTPPPPLPNEVNNIVKSVVEKALAKKTDKRYANAREMLTALEKAPLRNVVVAKATSSGDNLAVAGQPTPVPGRKSTKSQQTAAAEPKKRGPFALIAILGVLVIGGGIFLVPKMLSGSQKPTTTTGSTGGSTTTTGSTTGTSGGTSETTGTTGSTSSGTTGTTGTSGGTTEEIRTESKTETEPIPFETKTTDDPALPLGETKVDVEGVNGEREVTYEVKLKGDEVVSKTKVSENVTKPPVDKVIRNGTKPADVATTTKDVTEREPIRFSVERIPWPGLPKGKSQVIREGRSGSRMVTYRITMKGGKQVSKTKISSTVVDQPVSKMVRVGTGGGGASTTGGSGGTTGGAKPKAWFCPQCGERRSPSQNVCPNDGTPRPRGG